MVRARRTYDFHIKQTRVIQHKLQLFALSMNPKIINFTFREMKINRFDLQNKSFQHLTLMWLWRAQTLNLNEARFSENNFHLSFLVSFESIFDDSKCYAKNPISVKLYLNIKSVDEAVKKFVLHRVEIIHEYSFG